MEDKIPRLSRSQEVDLVFSYFLFLFSFSFDLFSYFLFLELRVRVRNDITQSHISYIRWYSDSDSHKVTSHMEEHRTF